MTLEEAKAALEAMLFSLSRPLSAQQLAETLDIEVGTVEGLLDQLAQQYRQEHHGIQLYTLAGGYVLGTKPEYSRYVRHLHEPVIRGGLSQAALETLAVIAYKQPCTKTDIEMIRGVNVDSAVNSLLSRELITEVGRKDAPGRPILYGTTEEFLASFGINHLDDLPQLPEKTLLQLEEIEAAATGEE